MKIITRIAVALVCCAVISFTISWRPYARIARQASAASSLMNGRYLFVAAPGIRDYLGYGGHGLMVFDIDHGHKFVKRIPLNGLHPKNGLPSNVKGIGVSLPLHSVYVTTLEGLQRIDIVTGKLIWEKPIPDGCDRLSVSPDGKTMYLPSLESHYWNVIDCETGNIIKRLDGFNASHNTIYALSGKHAYLADIKNTMVKIADTKTNEVTAQVGPFVNFVRPFTINRKETRIFVNCNDLLGFEVGDITTGKKIAHKEVEGWTTGPVRRHSCPSHGIGLTPDEKEVWLCDGFNMRMHVFSAVAPYQQLTTILLQDMPGWITFTIDGKYAYPSSGEVIDVKTRKIITVLQDENYNNVASEKVLEIDFKDGKPVRAGDQFGLGRVM
ncbi:YncE family protein [Mucilaginibacter sp. UYCu711]|uniref:YncE family protein n=1 Tax=Mucilaginibacter sp. UYCu711 TaxID=3156339 RepID=UPI003D245428